MSYINIICKKICCVLFLFTYIFNNSILCLIAIQQVREVIFNQKIISVIHVTIITYTANQWHNPRGFEGYNNSLVTTHPQKITLVAPLLLVVSYQRLYLHSVNSSNVDVQGGKEKLELIKISRYQKPVKCYGVWRRIFY